MSQFEVPQFVDVESKIIGPLTIKQFIIIAVPSLLAFLLFFVLNTIVWFFIAIILVSLGLSMAFVKIGGRPLYIVSLYAVRFFWRPKLFLWKRPIIEQVYTISSSSGKGADLAILAKRNALKLASIGISKISKLWQDLTTTRNPIPKREKGVPTKSISEIKEKYEIFKKTTGERDVARRVDYR